MLSRHRQAISPQGFTLIEMMVTVIIVAILMAVALPAYQQQLRRANRAAAQGQMLAIANLQQQFLLANRRYMDSVALAASGFTLDASVSRHYQHRLTLGTGQVPSYQLRLTPTGSQRDDGWLQLDSQGNRTAQYDGRWL